MFNLSYAHFANAYRRYARRDGTGTVLAAYLIRGGVSAEVAVRAVRAACPGAVGNASQEEALRAFAARRAWII